MKEPHFDGDNRAASFSDNSRGRNSAIIAWTTATCATLDSSDHKLDNRDRSEGNACEEAGLGGSVRHTAMTRGTSDSGTFEEDSPAVWPIWFPRAYDNCATPASHFGALGAEVHASANASEAIADRRFPPKAASPAERTLTGAPADCRSRDERWRGLCKCCVRWRKSRFPALPQGPSCPTIRVFF